MYAVQTINVREQWETVRKFWEWPDARNYAFYLRLDGYETRIIEISA